MANRPVFCPKETYIDICEIEFQWHPGMAVSQKKKSIRSLHNSAKDEGIFPVLEVSTKSDSSLGQSLSAFNLKLQVPRIGSCYLESVYQGSKKFTNGGPYEDIMTLSPYEAKKDSRLQSSGNLEGFILNNYEWSLTPPRGFYSWIYLKAMDQNKELADKLSNFKGFTDIEFNPKKSINCQAYCVALYLTLLADNSLNQTMESKEAFIEKLSGLDKKGKQASLF